VRVTRVVAYESPRASRPRAASTRRPPSAASETIAVTIDSNEPRIESTVLANCFTTPYTPTEKGSAKKATARVSARAMKVVASPAPKRGVA
jgi:hypothetical protein